MKLGVIGTGKIVQEFLPEILTIDGIEVLAILSSPSGIEKAQNICDRYGIGLATNDFEEFRASEIDTVYVAVPNLLHYNYCRQALEGGLNVIVEKPLTSNVSEAEDLAELAKRKKLFLFEAITTIYLKNYEKIQTWLPLIGDIKIVQSQYSQYSSRYDAFLKGDILPAFDPKKAGGSLMDLNLYNIHYVMGLLGKPEDAKYYANMENEIDTSGVLVMKYPAFTAVCTAAKDCNGMSGAIIQGTKGCIKSERSANMVGRVTLELNDGTTESFDAGDEELRVIPEFMQFTKAIDKKDYEFCYEQLDKSLAVSKLLTKVRLEAGIHFPTDK